jgi:bile acid:Na+ symporter, BASS family
MKIFQFIENHFWIFLLAGVVLGLIYPIYSDFLMTLLKPLLMIVLFLVFLKTDLVSIFKQVKDYRLMAYLVSMYMIIIPLLFFVVINIFNRDLALGILLLTSMPAGVSSASLTDIVKGNTALSLSITIITSLVAPFTVPLLFGFFNYHNLPISTFEIFKDLALLIFLPLILSQILKKIVPVMINKVKHIYTPTNILILFIIVFTAIGSQRDIILSNSVDIIWKTGFLYLVFILLHVIGYFLGYKQNKENKSAITIGAAYMNNGMAIVLAALYFDPSILILMVLSELPWNTLLGLYRKINQYL